MRQFLCVLFLFLCIINAATAQNNTSDTLQERDSAKWMIINNPLLFGSNYEIHVGVERSLDSTYSVGLDAGLDPFSDVKMKNYFVGAYFKKYVKLKNSTHRFYVKHLLFYRYELAPIYVSMNDTSLPADAIHPIINSSDINTNYVMQESVFGQYRGNAGYKGMEKVNTLAYEFLFGRDNMSDKSFYWSWYVGLGARVLFKQRIIKAHQVLPEWNSPAKQKGIDQVYPTLQGGILVGWRFFKKHKEGN